MKNSNEYIKQEENETGTNIINTHNFEVALQRIKEFATQKADDIKLKKVETERFFGLVGRDVSGKDFNEAMGVIQEHFISLNENHHKTVKEFGEIYNALDSLDKDYINAILVSIKATEKTSESLKIAQNDLEKTQEDQKRMLKILKTFKDKIDGYQHLHKIDEMWNDYQKWNEIMLEINKKQDSYIIELQKQNDKIDKAVLSTQEVIENDKKRDSILIELQKYNDKIDKAILNQQETNNLAIQKIDKKMQILSFATSVALCLSVVESIIILVKIL